MGDELIELGLGSRNAVPSGGGADLLGIVRRLLSLVAEVATGHESLKVTPEFRSCIERFQRVIAGASDTEEPLGVLAHECLTACEEFFSRAREHSLNREIEFIEIIDTLRETVRMLVGQSMRFSQSLIGSTERFERLIDIDDLQTIKEQIAVEARDLNRVIREKQKADEESYAKLSNRIERLQESLHRAEADAMRDPLTQTVHRGGFDRTVSEWVDSFGAGDSPFALAMVDLDDFKKINDTYGHQVGDRVLIGVAQVLQDSVRDGDIVARYGGEEFVVLLRNCPADEAMERFDRVLSTLASTRYEYGEKGSGQYLRFTASCGLAEFAGGENVESLLERVDEALYEAKKNGKNRIAVRKRSRLKALFGSKRPPAA